MTRLLLIRHAQSAPHRDIPDADWPLSPLGEMQAQRLVAVLGGLGITAVASSPYLRAIRTVQPFADAAGLAITVEPDLRERCITTAWVEDFATVLPIVHGDPHARLAGGESAHEARTRFEAALSRIAAAHDGGTAAVATHGSVIAHLLRHDHAELPDDYHARIRNPHVFEVHWARPRRWTAEWTLDGKPRVRF